MENKEEVFERIQKEFEPFGEIKSAYIYGSILGDKFLPGKSDIDLLLFVDDTDKPTDFLDRIRKVSFSLKDINVDTNVVFLSEFKKRWHIYRPVTYFIGIKLKSKLLFGIDLLEGVDEKEITGEMIYKRAVDLAQSSRGIYLNSKNPEFWEKKYMKWLQVLALEVLYLHGQFDLSFKSGLEKLTKIDPKLSVLKALLNDSADMASINRVAEFLRGYIYQNFILRNNE